MKTLIKGGRVLDYDSQIDEVLDILIEESRIVEVGRDLQVDVHHIIDADGKWVLPGLIDMHVHLREPGFEHKETIKTGTRSAAKGGFTSICPMPNTNPVIDNEYMVAYLNEKSKRDGIINIFPIGAITIGQKGEKLTNFGSMASYGIVALSDDGNCIMDTLVLKNAMGYAKFFELPILAHCEDQFLAKQGVIASGKKALELGLPGIDKEAEAITINRDIALARSTGVSLHICHISTKRGVELVRAAQKEGMCITAEVSPHHFTLTVDDIEGYDTNYKMSPPLRTEEDRKALVEGLMDGTIDVIATDHAPHHRNEKEQPFETAPFGVVGLETALAIAHTELVKKGILTPLSLVGKMSYHPAKILNIDRGKLGVGEVADITVFDPNISSVIDASQFESKSQNTPFHNKRVDGRVEMTIVAGKIVYDVREGF